MESSLFFSAFLESSYYVCGSIGFNEENDRNCLFFLLPWFNLFWSAVFRLALSADVAIGKFSLSNPFIMFGYFSSFDGLGNVVGGDGGGDKWAILSNWKQRQNKINMLLVLMTQKNALSIRYENMTAEKHRQVVCLKFYSPKKSYHSVHLFSFSQPIGCDYFFFSVCVDKRHAKIHKKPINEYDDDDVKDSVWRKVIDARTIDDRGKTNSKSRKNNKEKNPAYIWQRYTHVSPALVIAIVTYLHFSRAVFLHSL